MLLIYGVSHCFGRKQIFRSLKGGIMQIRILPVEHCFAGVDFIAKNLNMFRQKFFFMRYKKQKEDSFYKFSVISVLRYID